MATEKGFVAPSVSSLRKIMKPVISTDIMGNRNVEVMPVGARAEPALYFTHVMNPEYCDAVRAAEVEEEKIRAIQDQKAARLKQFQEDVRRRVRQINKTKRKQQLENDCQSMQNHLSQVRSSLRASDCLTERKDCLVPHPHPHPHHHPSALSAPPPSRSATHATLRGDLDQERGRRKKAFEKHNQQVHAFTSEARKKLSHRRVESDTQETDHLPGGRWVDTLEPKPLKTQETLSNDDDDDEENNNVSTDDDDEDNINQVLRSKNRNSSNSTDRLGHGQSGGGHVQHFSSLPHYSDAYANYQRVEKEEEERSEEESDDREDEDGGEEKVDAAKPQRVQFNLRPSEAQRPQSGAKQSGRKKGTNQSHSRRPTSAPDLQAGATEIAERRRLEQQKLTYRRLYSQLERQAVRDNQRRHQQRSQIQKIKREKEELRRQEEDRARRLVEPRDPMTGETSVESDLRQQMERSHLEEVIQGREDTRQKEREMIRYLDALRSNLREKLSKQGQELPALCCCGDTLFDTHPETCANNCFYYKNHRAYARALQSLLTSSEIL